MQRRYSRFKATLIRLLIPLLGYGIFAGTAFSQVSGTDILRVKILYNDAAFSEAIDAAQQLLRAERAYLPEELAFLHQYAALAFYNLGTLDSARVHFLSLLSIAPETELDPVEVSPKIIEFFEEIKAERPAPLPSVSGTGHTRYIFLDDLRVGASWRSAFLPGWGQFYKGQKARGSVLGGAFWGGLIGAGISLLKEQAAKDQYNDATAPAAISEAYDTYNRWYKTRRTLTAVTVALWAVTVADAGLSRYPRSSFVVGPEGELLLALRIPLR